MGLIFRTRRRRNGGGFTLILLLFLLALAVPWFARYGAGLQTRCENISHAFGGYGAGLCQSMGRITASLEGIGGLGTHVNGRWQDTLNDWRLSFDNANIQEKIRGVKARFDEQLSGPLGSYVSSDNVQSLLSGSGASFGTGARGQLSGALSSLVAGQKLLRGDGIAANPSQALDVYKQGANVGAFGLLPQLELGSLYSQGGYGVTPDIGLATQYQSQALDSLRTLRSSNTPEAQSLLQGLAIDPQTLQLQLEEGLARLRSRSNGFQ